MIPYGDVYKTMQRQEHAWHYYFLIMFKRYVDTELMHYILYFKGKKSYAPFSINNATKVLCIRPNVHYHLIIFSTINNDTC